VGQHFAERIRQEQINFGHESEFVTETDTCGVRMIGPGGLNSTATVDFLESFGVGALVVYGTNLIRGPLLTRWAGRIVNLHLGLSPYYRGTATNFYPLLNEEPQYVGATIHLIDAGIDSGPILKHARPTIVAADGPHTIGCKAILAGIDAMVAVLMDLSRGELRSVPQWKAPNARLYLRKDYHPRQVVDLYRKLDAGLIPRYVERSSQLPSPVRLVE
jgi:methionyl-tRNA formyltransferase